MGPGAGGSCTYTVQVKAAHSGYYTLKSSPISSNETAPGAPGEAALYVQ